MTQRMLRRLAFHWVPSVHQKSVVWYKLLAKTVLKLEYSHWYYKNSLGWQTRKHLPQRYSSQPQTKRLVNARMATETGCNETTAQTLFEKREVEYEDALQDWVTGGQKGKSAANFSSAQTSLANRWLCRRPIQLDAPSIRRLRNPEFNLVSR